MIRTATKLDLQRFFTTYALDFLFKIKRITHARILGLTVWLSQGHSPRNRHLLQWICALRLIAAKPQIHLIPPLEIVILGPDGKRDRGQNKKENMNGQTKLIDDFAADFKAIVKRHGIILDQYSHEGEETFFVFKSFRDDSCVRLDELMRPVYHGKPRPK